MAWPVLKITPADEVRSFAQGLPLRVLNAIALDPQRNVVLVNRGDSTCSRSLQPARCCSCNRRRRAAAMARWSAPRVLVQPDSLYAELEAMAVVATVPRNWAVELVDSGMLAVALAAAFVLHTG